MHRVSASAAEFRVLDRLIGHSALFSLFVLLAAGAFSSVARAQTASQITPPSFAPNVGRGGGLAIGGGGGLAAPAGAEKL